MALWRHQGEEGEELTMSFLDKVDRKDLTARIGTELSGIQLAQLGPEELGEIARLASERCVVTFRDQEMSLEDQVAIGQGLGELVRFPGVKGPAGIPEEVMVVHADEHSKAVPGEGWHSDVSCEERPPAYSMLRIETTPPVGGDTVFASMYAAFETLSPPIQNLLVGLVAVHSGRHAGARYGYPDPDAHYPENVHPVVRMHPVTKRRALFVNSGYTSHIEGLQPEESAAILHMLFDHVANGVASQVRFSWAPGSVALWDNRCTQHHACWDYYPALRHGYRVTTRGERPTS
jgi:taurine dioxygenase